MREVKVNELRIGNNLQDNGSLIEVCVGMLNYLGQNEDNDIKPIPLTEEWLLKLGFEEGKENAGTLKCFRKGKYTIAKWIGDKWQFWMNTVDVYNSPQHVHQIQNLYFALTNTELTIK